MDQVGFGSVEFGPILILVLALVVQIRIGLGLGFVLLEFVMCSACPELGVTCSSSTPSLFF